MEKGEQCLENAIGEIESIREELKDCHKENETSKNKIQELETTICKLQDSIKARDLMLSSARKSAKQSRKKQRGSRGGRGRNSLSKTQLLLSPLGCANNAALDNFFEEKTSIFNDGWAVFSRDPSSVCMHIIYHLGYVGVQIRRIYGVLRSLCAAYDARSEGPWRPSYPSN